jgi:hypothetical protein
MTKKAGNTTAKDVSAWVFRSINANNDTKWASPSKAIDTVILMRLIVTIPTELLTKLINFVWRNIDSFVGLQQYLETHPPRSRPNYTALKNEKIQEQFSSAFEDDAPRVKIMSSIRSGKDGTISAGLWPLDTTSCVSWRSGRYPTKTINEFIQMAKIEIEIVDSYRLKLLENCPEAAFIRLNVASFLAPLCSPVVKTVDRKPTFVRQFIYPDNINFTSDSLPLPPPVDVRAVKSTRDIMTRIKSLATEAKTAIRRIEKSPACSAVPGGPAISRDISESISELIYVSNGLNPSSTTDLSIFLS